MSATDEGTAGNAGDSTAGSAGNAGYSAGNSRGRSAADGRVVARALAYQVEGRMLFHDLDLSVGAGHRLAVLGPSGSGKTSLLALLAGLSVPTRGTVHIDGQQVGWGVPPGVSVVLQGYGLVALLTAAENVEVGLRLAGVHPRDAVERAQAELAGLGLGEHSTHLVDQLSGGQQQRVAVARALAVRPRVLIADEPTAEQDPVTRALVLDRLLSVSERGGTVVLATHDPEVAARCDQTIRIAG